MASYEDHRIAWADRFLPIPGLLATTAISCALLALQITQWRGSQAFAEYVINDRSTVAIIVQILSYLLGLIQFLIFGAVLKCSLVVGVKSKPFNLHLANLIHDAALPRFSFHLPWLLQVPLLLVVAFSLVPGALWSAALTPILSERQTIRSIEIPNFTSNASDLWFGNDSTSVPGGGGLKTWISTQGVFSFDPATNRARIVDSASSATFSNASGSFHAKLDRTGYVFVNRSYGAGSAAGQTIGYNPTPLWYNYTEPGFLTNATCTYNKSMAFSLTNYNINRPYGLLWEASGETPDGNGLTPWSYLGYTIDDTFAWAASYDRTSRSFVVIMFATAQEPDNDKWAFANFNATQCRVTFKPATFNVLVNSTNKLIEVNQTSDQTSTWPPYGHDVATQVANWINSFSFVDAQSGGSELGRSLRLNANYLQRRQAGANNTETLMQSIEAYLLSATDNIINQLLSTRFAAGSNNATRTVEATIALPAVTFGGDSRYLYGVLAVNFLILFIYVEELIRTRAWKGIHPVNFTDLGSVVLGLVKGDLTVVGSSTKDGIPLKPRNGLSGNFEPETPYLRSNAFLDDSIKLRLNYNRSMPGLGYSYASVATDHEQDGFVNPVPDLTAGANYDSSAQLATNAQDFGRVSPLPSRPESTHEIVR